MTGLNTKTTALDTLLTATNEKLDAIIELMSAAPTPPTATLDDLLAVLQDIHTDTMSIDGKLLTIRDSITDDLVPELVDIHTDTSSMDGKLLAIRNALIAPGEDDIPDDSGLLWNVFRLRKAVALASYEPEGIEPIQLTTYEFYSLFNTLMAVANARLNNIENILLYSATNLGLNVTESTQEYTGYLFDSLNWLGLISGATGVPIDADNRNVIQLLAEIADVDNTECCIGSGIAPNDLCDEPYLSTGMTLVPSVFDAYPSIVYAVFGDTPPSPLGYGSVFGIGIDNAEITITDTDWTGWGIYVASSAANFGLYIGGDSDQSLARYPTNVWVDLAFYAYNLSVYVGGSDSLRVYLCNGSWGGESSSGGPWGGGSSSGGPLPWVDCVDVESTAAEYFSQAGSDTPFTMDLQAITFGSVPYGGCATEHPYTGHTEGFDAACSVWVGNFNGVTVELLSGSTPIIIIWVKDGARDTVNLNSTGAPYTIPTDTDTLLICNAAVGSPASHPFTVRICPPAP